MQSGEQDVRTLGARLREIVGLETCPVGVYLQREGDRDERLDGFVRVERHRYCQAVMRARAGEPVLLDPDECACPAARAAFGWKALPAGLASGQGLVGFGIVGNPATGRRMFEGMPHLASGNLQAIALAPLDQAPPGLAPDVVVVEAPPEHLMWLLLADLNRAGGDRRRAHTAVLQAMCVDSMIVPLLERRLSFSFGCYGCREATDIGVHEASLGLPGAMLPDLVESLTMLKDKAMPRSRAKGAWRSLVGRDTAGAVAENAPSDPEADRPGAWRVEVGALPRLEGDLVLSLSPAEVMQVFQAALDEDEKAALGFVAGTLHRRIRRILERPHCSPAFERYRQRSE
jgi:uncharacterized protein (DUF169 family)